jgi:hypothetical protein
MKKTTLLIGLAAFGLVLLLMPRATSVQDSAREPDSTAPNSSANGSQPKSTALSPAMARSVSGDRTGAKGVPFADFRVSVEPEEEEVDIKGSFTLGEGSNGINLFKEATSIKIGSFSANIPPGAFKQGNKGKVEFQKLIECRYWDLYIRPTGKDAFEFNLEVQGAKEAAKLKAVDVVVTIGDDVGTAKPAS